MALGCLIVILAAAGATAALVLGQVDQLAGALSLSRALDVSPRTLAPASAGGPQTLLLVGNDQRHHTTTAPVLPHSNEMLLVRFDPSKPWISMMSIPRELLTTIDCPGGAVTTRFNYSLTCGGFSTLVRTVKQVTGLSVNHVAMIDFNNFKRAINEIGCVYATVDRRYYHVNTPTSAQYQQINLHPGYQDMCGTQALQFVSYRHGDTSLIRDARDQDFLLAIKQQYGPTLVDNIGKFERIFGQTVQTDGSLHTTGGLLDLIDTLISSAELPVRQVRFQVNLDPSNPQATACACVTASSQQIAASVHSFLYGNGLPPGRRQAASLARRASQHPARSSSVSTGSPELQPAVGRSLALAAASKEPFPLEFPRVQDELGPPSAPDIRTYSIRAPGGFAYPIYVEVFSTGLLGQYYDVQGTTWLTAPAFDNPTQTVRISGHSYELWYSGQHIDQVAWFAHNAVYWIHNTLTDALGNAAMLAVAEQTAPVDGTDTPVRTRVRLRAAPAPVYAPDAERTSTLHSIGSILGLLALLALPLALALAVLERRRISEIRGRLAEATARTLRLEGEVVLASSSGALGGWSPVRVNAAPSRRPLVLLIIGALGLLGLAAALALLLSSGTTHRRAAHPLPRPTARVAVLNASTTPHAAHRLAVRLARQGIHIVAVSDLGAAPPIGYEVLYTPGERTQARRTARLIHRENPIVAPLDPTAAAAAGPSAQVVVVIP
jgi:LCP family protein required for cell wall assembly